MNLANAQVFEEIKTIVTRNPLTRYEIHDLGAKYARNSKTLGRYLDALQNWTYHPERNDV